MQSEVKKAPMSEWTSFLATRRSEATRRAYVRWAKKAVGDPDAFIQLARTDRGAAEKILADMILETRTHAGGATITNYLMPVKSFLDYNEVHLSWRKLRSLAPPAKAVASDRAPELEELRRMWAVADPRERLGMSMLVSLGGRRGAFHFPSVRGGYGWMKLRDVVFLDDGTASVVVYPGEPEEYRTLISPEAVQQLKLCLELRARVGEDVTPESPVMRDEWNAEYGWHPEEARPVTAAAVSAMFQRLRRKAGITTTSRSGGFKAAHGFRKFFKSNFPSCPQHGDLEADVLMGHRRPYDKLSWEHLRERYRAAVPYLVIDEKFRLKEEIAAAEAKHESEWTRTRLELLEAKERMREVMDVLAEMRPLVEELRRRSAPEPGNSG